MYYYRKSTKNDYEDDIRNLNNNIDIIYSLLENITKDRNDLLILFNSSSYEILINVHQVSILNNQDHIKRLIYKTNKLDDKLKENNKLIREFILKDIKKDDLPIK